MKFKKTKLTALAMSVLMAASTITSVTWAADLFTDGAPAEVAVEAPVEVISDGEVEEVNEITETNGDLLAASSLKYDYDTLDYDVNGVYLRDGKYYIKIKSLKYQDTGDPVAAFTNKEWPVTYSNVVAVAGTCQKEALMDCTFQIEDNGQILHANFKGEKLDHQYIEGKEVRITGTTKPIHEGDPCLEYETYFAYYECPYCHQIMVRTATGHTFKAISDTIDADYYLAHKDETSVDSVILAAKQTMPAGHTWKKDIQGVIPPDNLNYLRLAEDHDKRVKDLTDKIGDYAKLANCKILNGQPAGTLDPEQDAFYYIYDECSVCGTTEGKVDVFYRANMKEGDRFYKVGDNVKGFVTKNSDGSLSIYKDTNGNCLKTIPEEKFFDVVLNDCSKTGKYYLCVVDSGTPGKPIEIKDFTKQGHTLDRIKINYDSTLVQSEYAAGKYETNGKGTIQDIVCDYDADHNVTAVHSKNCSTEAFYELEQVCFNEDNCGYRVTSVDGQRKATAGSHVWENLGRDQFKIDYTQVDALHHIEHYYDNVKCTLCNKKDQVDSETPDALVSHKFTPAEVKDTRVEPTCGTTGSYKRADTCPCGYIDESTTTTVTIPATDAHKFEGDAYLEWSGEVYIANFDLPKRSFHVDVVRKCSVCGATDSNGINTMVPKSDLGADGDIGTFNRKDEHFDKETLVPAGKWCATIHVDPKSIVDAKKDPATGVTYPCSTAHATIYVDWVGTVDGKVVKLSETKENVPYYASLEEYDGRTAHHKAPAVKENVTPTSYDEVIYCEVCGDEISRKTVTVTPEAPISVPTVTATAANYNTVNVSWTPVDGATSYRLYYRSADLGITTWHRVRTLKGTSFTHSGLTTGARYRYTVRAEVNGKLGDYSRTGSVARPLPAAPEMKSVTAVSNGTKVTWSKVDGADGYIIFRKTTGAFTRVGAVSRGSKVTWTDKKPVSGATYKVRAYRTVNNVNYKGAFSTAM